MPNFDFDKFIEEWNNFNPNISIALKDNIKPMCREDHVICHCNICGGTFISSPRNLITSIHRNGKYKGCRICSGQEIQVGINDFATKHPNLMKYIVNPNDVKDVASSTNRKRILCKCDHCDYQVEKNIYDLIRYGFNCPRCSSGFSAPNRFIRVLMIQFPVQELKFEYKASWTKNKCYDCYFVYKDKQYVIEMDGEQHFKDAWYTTKEERKKNDTLKDKLALENNVTIIRIDCRTTDYQYIHDNIVNSILFNIFDFSQVDWDICKDALTNDLLIRVCQYYNKNYNNTSTLTAKQIGSYFNISHDSVVRYLNKGNQLGLCKYRGRDFINNAIRQYRGATQLVYDLNGNFIGRYQTITELRDIFNLLKSDTDEISYAQNHGINRIKIKNYYFERELK